MSNYRIDTRTIVPGLAVTLADGVLSVTIDRPESLNSLTKPVLAGMADAIEGAATDPRVKVVRLGGAGRGFSSGGAISVDDVWASGPPTDTVAEANRTSDSAFFMLANTKVALMPDGGASALVAAATGRIRAMRLALLAEQLPAREALAWGLISAVYPDSDFEAEVDKVISRLLAGPALAFAQAKNAINAAALTELEPTFARELDGQEVLLRTHDFAEGAAAFLQRRTPNFTGS